MLTVGVALTASLIVQIGLALAARLATINRFMLVGSGATVILVAPLLRFAGLADWPWTLLVPTHASLVLIGGAFGDRPPLATVAASTSWLLLWNVPAHLWARRWIARYGAGRLPRRGSRGPS
jgi:hypothetical protein